MESGDVLGYDKSCQERMSKSAISHLCSATEAHLIEREEIWEGKEAESVVCHCGQTLSSRAIRCFLFNLFFLIAYFDKWYHATILIRLTEIWDQPFPAIQIISKWHVHEQLDKLTIYPNYLDHFIWSMHWAIMYMIFCVRSVKQPTAMQFTLKKRFQSNIMIL